MGMLYRTMAGLVGTSIRAAGVRTQVDGLEHLPVDGPAILAANHVGYLDFAFIMLAPPRPRREMHFMARGDLFDHWLLGPLLPRLGQIPVDEHGDPTTPMVLAERVLTAGGIVGLHPEAMVNPTFLPIPAKSGAVRLAQRTGAPIIPCAVWGSQRLVTKWRPVGWPERGIVVRTRFGAPFHPPQGNASRGGRELMQRIGTMVDELIAEEAAPAGAWWVPAARGGGALTHQEFTARLAALEAERRARQAPAPQTPEPEPDDPLA
jgi:1-acyl-sn-glycerol-3-phosphate acyltransferase